MGVRANSVPAIIVPAHDLEHYRAHGGGEIVRPVGRWWRAAMFRPGRPLWLTCRIDGSGELIGARARSWSEQSGLGRLGVELDGRAK